MCLTPLIWNHSAQSFHNYFTIAFSFDWWVTTQTVFKFCLKTLIGFDFVQQTFFYGVYFIIHAYAFFPYSFWHFEFEQYLIVKLETIAVCQKRKKENMGIIMGR